MKSTDKKWLLGFCLFWSPWAILTSIAIWYTWPFTLIVILAGGPILGPMLLGLHLMTSSKERP